VSPRRLVLWRHGETDYNAVGRMQGHLDSALTPRGWNQARFAVPALARFSPDLVIASDLRRATDTATVLTDAIGVPLRIDGRNIGSLNVYAKERRVFVPDEVSLPSALADHAALAIHKARLLREAEELIRGKMKTGP